MITKFLRFPTETAFLALCPGFERVGETGAPLPDGVEAISIIGTIVAPATYDVRSGALVTPETELPGFHVNVLGAMPEAWRPYQITVNTPDRVFG